MLAVRSVTRWRVARAPCIRAHVGELSFTVVQSECRPSFGAFAKCLDKNNVDFSLCRKEAAAFSACAAAADAAFAAKPNVDKTA